MTTATITRIAHDDATVRTIALSNGVTYTVADDPDTNDDYCLTCEEQTVPVCAIVIHNGEEWSHVDGKAGEPFCPQCMESWLCMEYDAPTILREYAEDCAAEVAYQAWKDGD